MITIIIPVYNGERYIADAINSLLRQSYTDLEILVINDASIDSTHNVVSSFSDSRIREVVNERNVGAGMSRRIGTQLASGEYIMFLDADDMYRDNFVSDMYSYAVKYDSELVTSESLTQLLNDGTMIDSSPVFVNNSIISTDLFRSGKVEYCGRRYIEDTPTFYQLECSARNPIVVKNNGYIYRENELSLTHTSSFVKETIYGYWCSYDIERYSEKFGKPLPDYVPSRCYLANLVARGVTYKDIEPYMDDCPAELTSAMREKFALE